MAAGGLEVGPWCAHDPAYRPSRERSLRLRANAWWSWSDSNQQLDCYGAFPRARRHGQANGDVTSTQRVRVLGYESWDC